MTQPPKDDTPASMEINDIPILLRRRIEAMLLKHVLDVITERSGREEAEAVIGTTCSKSAIEQGQMLAQDLGRPPDLTDFAAIQPNWTREDALRIEPVEMSEEKMDFNVVKCRYAEMYRDMGLGDIGHLLSCNRDGDFCIGYNPNIEMTRTQTIMKGASHCDFRYRMKKDV
ncbi:L-2-amino-thiazoline-4-carboxylic acid hydrolase [Roseobacter sp.]|uniref:L-2-amino-thiazoline-4-carboxylic acid hydrolase n=1 Tax=Roseobacter sp. TaxID=1907202 RepID=UPI003297D413